MPDEVKKISPHLRTATFIPGTFNEVDNTVEATCATEAEVLQYSWEEGGLIREVLSMKPGEAQIERMKSANILDNHNNSGSVTKTILGVVERAWTEGQEMRVKLRFSKREDLKDFVNDVKDGIQKNLSIGYRVYAYTVTEEVGKIPLYRATSWEPYEVSFVSVPADFKATVRSNNNTTTNEVTIHHTNSNFRNMPEDNVGAPAATAQTTPAAPATPAANAATTPPAATQPNPTLDQNTEHERSLARKAEKQRSADILLAVRSAGFDLAYAETLLNDEAVTVDKARQMILDKMAGTQSPANTRSANASATVGADETDKLRKVITDGLTLRTGAVDPAKMKAEDVSAAREFRGRSLMQIAEDCLIRSGVTTSEINRMSKMELAGAALGFSSRAAISNSSSDFSVILGGVIHQVLLANYNAIPDTWRSFCTVGSVSDFRPYSRLRLGSFSRLDQVNENAEYKNKPIPDATAESISAQTFGNTVNLSRKMIINDDLGAFSRITAGLGRAAARSIEIDVYALLASNPVMGDGYPLFDATHNNLVTGSAMTVAGMDSLRIAMAQQKDPSGNDFLDIRPEILLAPISLGGTARVINEAQFDVDVSNKFQIPNRSRGLFKQIIDSPRLAGTTYYVFANPAEEPVLEVVFLDGVQTPYLESEIPFDTDGLRWKIRHDYGIGAIGWRGAIKNPGA